MDRLDSDYKTNFIYIWIGIGLLVLCGAIGFVSTFFYKIDSRVKNVFKKSDVITNSTDDIFTSSTDDTIVYHENKLRM
jgi:hypothetical protein